MRIEFTEEISLGDFLQAHRYHTRVVKYIVYIALIVAGTFLFLGGDQVDRVSPLLHTIILVWITVMVAYWEIFVPCFIIRARYRASALVKGSFNVAIDDEKMIVENGAISSTTSWDAYVTWKETRDVILLYVDANTFVIVPKRYLNQDQLDELKRFLTVHYSTRGRSGTP